MRFGAFPRVTSMINIERRMTSCTVNLVVTTLLFSLSFSLLLSLPKLWTFLLLLPCHHEHSRSYRSYLSVPHGTLFHLDISTCLLSRIMAYQPISVQPLSLTHPYLLMSILHLIVTWSVRRSLMYIN